MRTATLPLEARLKGIVVSGLNGFGRFCARAFRKRGVSGPGCCPTPAAARLPFWMPYSGPYVPVWKLEAKVAQLPYLFASVGHGQQEAVSETVRGPRQLARNL